MMKKLASVQKGFIRYFSDDIAGVRELRRD